jgi:hypothetical protein
VVSNTGVGGLVLNSSSSNNNVPSTTDQYKIIPNIIAIGNSKRDTQAFSQSR